MVLGYMILNNLVVGAGLAPALFVAHVHPGRCKTCPYNQI